MARSLFAAAPSNLRRFEARFASVTRVRGLDYATRGLVRIVESTMEAVVAEVQGHDTYDVELRIVGTTLRAHCTCPHFTKGEACKHVWATLMVADRARTLPSREKVRELELEAVVDE